MNEPDSDDDRTRQADTPPARDRLRPESASDEPDRLPIGIRLGEFELTGFVGQGGFSMVYLAWDHSLERRVAVKEYMPSSLASRSGRSHVAARSERHRETFDAGLKSFVNEGKLLAQFDHPSLVKVYRFWEQNGTAYMAMPFYEGTTLKDTVLAMGKPPEEKWLLRVLDPLTAALAVIHAEHCFHRDIAPDNVLLLKGSGKPLLLDFGAARRVIGDRTQALTVILKPGYAPVEQYAEDPHLRQGAWTDVYALAAVVYWSITGKTPPTSVGRMLSDAYVPLMQCARGRYGDQLLTAIDRALRVLPDERTRSIEQLRLEMGIRARGEEPDAARQIARVDPDATVLQPKVARDRSATTPEPVATSRSRWGLLSGGSVAAVALMVGAWWLMRPTAPPPVPTPSTNTPAPDPAPAPPPAPAPQPRPVLGAVDAVSLLSTGRDPSIELSASRQVLKGGAAPVQYRSNEAGYAYLIGVDPAANEWVMLYPAGASGAQRLPAQGQLEVASSSSATLPRHYLLVAREPRELREGGWAMREQRWVRRFDAGSGGGATQLSDVWSGPRCAEQAPRCDSGYGMTEVIDVTNVMTTPEVAAVPRNSTPSRQAGGPAATTADAPVKREKGRSTEVKPRPQESAGTSAQCAEILRRMSLGDTSAALIERLKTLGCR